MTRIRRLLQPQLLPNPRFRTAAFALAAAGLLAGTVAQQPKAATPTSKQAHSLDLDREGAVWFDLSAEHPVHVGKHGRFNLKETIGGVTRTYTVNATGEPVYTVNGVPRTMDDAGQAWLKDALARTQREARPSSIKARVRAEVLRQQADEARMDAEQERLDAEQDRAEAERIQIEDMPEVTTETRDGKQHLIVRKQGKVVTDEVMPDPPEVSMTDEGPGRERLIIKRDGKVVENKIIEIPEVTTVEKNGQMHIVVKKGGKVTEDRVIALPKEGEWSVSPEAEAEVLREQIRSLQERLDALEGAKGRAVPPPPPTPPVPPAPPVEGVPAPPPPPPAPPAPPAE